MRRKKQRKGLEGGTELDINMTPMIDIVFQLLIFFVLTAKFIKLEGQLLSYLPKGRGTPTTQQDDLVEPLIIYLRWEGEPETGFCKAIVTNYKAPDGTTHPQYTFPTSAGEEMREVYGNSYRALYPQPNFLMLKDYMRTRKQVVESTGASKFPVTINFEDAVPVQMVVNMLDICQQLKIKDFSINATGFE